MDPSDFKIKKKKVINVCLQKVLHTPTRMLLTNIYIISFG
jgi:hypothetical protein